MNILIPMAGSGSRFKNNGVITPKPFIEIYGKTMIQHAVESLDLDGRYIFVVHKSHKDFVPVTQILQEIKPDCIIIETAETTMGPACSALLSENYIADEELVITNCDQIMKWSGQYFLHCARMYDGTIVTYYNNSSKNSYAKLDNNGNVLCVKEKQIISNVSLNGIHYYKFGKYFVDAAKSMITHSDSVNGEFYVGPTYNYMIASGLKVGIHHIPNEQHYAVGTPEDLKHYIEHNRYDSN